MSPLEPGQITLYWGTPSPFAQRVAIALEEANVEYTRYEIDLNNKPPWFAAKVNPLGQIPAITYGGPKVPADEPSEESFKLAESLVLLEFIAEVLPSSGLLPPPSDPIGRAKVRFFIEKVTNTYGPAQLAVLLNSAPGGINRLLAALEVLQALLPPLGKGRFVLGDQFTIADAAVAPQLARLEIVLKNEFGAYPAGEGLEGYKELTTSKKYARIWQYIQDLQGRDSFKNTFDEQKATAWYAARFARQS